MRGYKLQLRIASARSGRSVMAVSRSEAQYHTVILSVTILLLSGGADLGVWAQTQEEGCLYNYTAVPNPECLDCNPVVLSQTLGHTVTLQCGVVGIPSPNIRIRWYWSPNKTSDGIRITNSTATGIEFTLTEFSIFQDNSFGPATVRLISSFQIVQFNESNTGYYQCQVAIDDNTPLKPSDPIFIERNDSLPDCSRRTVFFTPQEPICADLNETVSPLPTASASISFYTSTPPLTATPLPTATTGDQTSSESLALYQALAVAVSVVCILLIVCLIVLCLCLVYKLRNSPKKKKIDPEDQINVARSPKFAPRPHTLSQKKYALPLPLPLPLPPPLRETVHTSPPVEPPKEGRPNTHLSQSVELYTLPDSVVEYQNVDVNEMGRPYRNQFPAKYQPLKIENADYMHLYSSCTQREPLKVTKNGSEYCICSKNGLDGAGSYEAPLN